MEEEFSKGQAAPSVEEAPYYETRVKAFVDLYVSCWMDEAEEYFDDVKLRDFFGCERVEFQKDGLVNYREALINCGYREWPCPWLYGKMCFPVKERWCEAEEI